MSEQVTITPQSGLDAYDNPLPAATPFTMTGLVAPTDTTIAPGADGSLDTLRYTVYLPLRVKRTSGWVRTVAAMTDNFTITVRGQQCIGRAREWEQSGRGGVEVLASAETGATP